MLKTIFSAIGAALRAAVSCVRAVLSIPGRLLGSVFGGPLAGPPAGDSPAVADLAARVAEEDAKAADNGRRIANAIWHWCMDSLIAGGPVAVPSWLPRSIKEWAPGLTMQEAEKLAASDKTALQSHLRGLFAVPGVRKVQRLEPVKEWPPEQLYVEPAPGWAAQFARPAPGRGCA